MHFPTTCIDHFFKYPDAVRKYANTLTFQPEPEGRWPGQRTKELHLENDNLFNPSPVNLNKDQTKAADTINKFIFIKN